MRLLLDTNVLIPVIRQDITTLNSGIAGAVASAANDMFASIASLWEIAIKTRLGKLDVKMEMADLPAYLDSSRIGLLAIGATHVLAELVTEPNTRDPFDRLLLAQCQVENMRLVTTDRALSAHPLAWR
jgi:PIN domain nuclease of toxin-antitoxin system